MADAIKNYYLVIRFSDYVPDGAIKNIGETFQQRLRSVGLPSAKAEVISQMVSRMGGSSFPPHLWVTFGAVGAYVGKKAIDFIFDMIKDTALHDKGDKPTTIKLYGPDNNVVYEVTSEEYRWYKYFRYRRWRWRWYNRFRWRLRLYRK